MAIYGAFNNARIYVNGVDLTGYTNMVRVVPIKEVKDRTTFGNNARVRVMAGLADVEFTAAGFAEMETVDQAFRAMRQTNTVNTTVMVPATNTSAVAAGDIAWFFQGVHPQYDTGGQHGEDVMWNLNMSAGAKGYPLAFGKVLDPGTTAITADGNGTGVEAGAVAEGQYAYALVHAVSVSTDDTDDITIESAPTDDFADPTTRFTFTQITAAGSEYLVRIAGPITDTWWRVVHNVTGAADVSIKCAVVIAIQ